MDKNTPYVVVNVHNEYHTHVDLSEVISNLNTINSNLKIMGQNTDKALEDLAAIQTQLTKVGQETSTLLQKITDLENAAANADTPQSVLDAIQAVKTQAQAVDDEVPDAQP
jgi:hypothetical protein